MLCFEILASRVRRTLRTRNCVRARSVWRIERRRLSVALLDLDDGSGAEEDDAARSSIVSIWRYLGQHGEWDTKTTRGVHTCKRTRSIIRSINAVGHGRISDTARSATQNRVRSWWSIAVEAVLAPAPRSTEARMSSMSMAFCNSSLLDWFSRENRAEGGAEGGDGG